jgi:hypothetical protein
VGRIEWTRIKVKAECLVNAGRSVLKEFEADHGDGRRKAAAAAPECPCALSGLDRRATAGPDSGNCSRGWNTGRTGGISLFCFRMPGQQPGNYGNDT